MSCTLVLPSSSSMRNDVLCNRTIKEILRFCQRWSMVCQLHRNVSSRLAVALAGCTITNGFGLQYRRQTCGPHQGTSMKRTLTDLINSAPRCGHHVFH